MPTGNRDEVFLQKLQEFESLIRYASNRYHIPGVLDPEDLYQEGLLILDKVVTDELANEWVLASRRSGARIHVDKLADRTADFRKMFKTELWHGLWHVLQKFKTKKRDWRKLEQNDFSDINRSVSEDYPWDRSLTRSASVKAEDISSVGLDPEQIVELAEKLQEVDSFLDILINRLDDEARVVLHELLYPRSWDEIPKVLRTNGYDDEYWRVPKKIPQHVLARMLGWSLIRVRRAISRIRKQATVVGDELGLDILAVTGFRKRRKKNAKA